MILSNKKKTESYVTPRVIAIRMLRFARGFGGMLPQEIFYFQSGFLDF